MFFGLLNPFSLVVGLLATTMFVMQASSWPSFRTGGERARRAGLRVGLKVMLFIALSGMPLVLGYTIWIYRESMGVVVLDEHSS